jgi:hypothetical protein
MLVLDLEHLLVLVLVPELERLLLFVLEL